MILFYHYKKRREEMENKKKKEVKDWFDSHVIVSGLDKKANKKIKESLKERLAKEKGGK